MLLDNYLQPEFVANPIGSNHTYAPIFDLRQQREREPSDPESERQIDVLTSGGHITQETRGWDEERGVTLSQRTKEGASDYRYFPEPDLPPLIVSREWVERIRAATPELPSVAGGLAR